MSALRRWWHAYGWIVAITVVVIGVGAVVVAGLFSRSIASREARASPSAVESDRYCGIPGRSASTPITDRVTAGPVSFPVAAAPGWRPQQAQAFSHGAEVVGLATEVVPQTWEAHVEVGLTAFAPKLETAAAARRILACLADESAYTPYSPRFEGLTDPEPLLVDGVPAVRVSGRLLVGRDGLPFPGDVVTVVVIDSAPQAYFESDTPIGDTALAAVAQQVFEQLKVARDV